MTSRSVGSVGIPDGGLPIGSLRRCPRIADRPNPGRLRCQGRGEKIEIRTTERAGLRRTDSIEIFGVRREISQRHLVFRCDGRVVHLPGQVIGT